MVFLLAQIQDLFIGIYFQHNLSLILCNLFLEEPIFKIDSLNLFSMDLTFRYREILRLE